MEINGSAAVVTGGASGLGFATAGLLAQRGARVTLLDLGADRVKAAANEIDALGIACDVADEDQVTAALAQAQSAHGTARINVNCAGVPGSMRLVDKNGPVDMQRYRQVVEINLLGTVSVMTKCAAQMMAAQPLNEDGERGVIVNTASITAFEGMVGQGAYAASKAAIAALSLQAAREFADWGIRVVGIAPGLFATPMADHVPETVRASMLREAMFPRRFGQPEEFGEMVVAVCTNAMLNGTTLRLDGGVRLRSR